MTATETRPSLEVPARSVPVPTTVSAEAQAVLAMGAMTPATEPAPALDDLEGWRAQIAEREQGLLAMLSERASRIDADVVEIDLGGCRVWDISPRGVPADDRNVVLEIHGGALVHGAGETGLAMSLTTAGGLGRRLWAVDYRMPPDHPYPTPLDDCLAAYRALLEQRRPEEIIVHGASAGGNLAAALLLRARDEGLPLPAGAVLVTPELDLTESGDSFQTNVGLDTVLTRSLMPTNLLYAGGHPLDDPYVSPLFGDFTKGFPPTILTTGTRDLFLSNTVLMHRALRRAEIPAELHVLEAAPHGGFFGAAPEDAELTLEIRRFIARQWA